MGLVHVTQDYDVFSFVKTITLSYGSGCVAHVDCVFLIRWPWCTVR